MNTDLRTSPVPVPGADTYLARNRGAWIPPVGDGRVLVVPGPVSVSDIAYEATDLLESLGRDAVVLLEEEDDAADSDLLSLIETAMGLPADAELRSVPGRWLARHRDRLAQTLVVVQDKPMVACGQLLSALAELVVDSRDWAERPAFLVIARAPVRSLDWGALVFVQPDRLEGSNSPTSRSEVSWARFVSQRLYWETGGRWHQIEGVLGALGRIRHQSPSAEYELMRALEERALNELPHPPLPSHELIRSLLRSDVIESTLHRDDQIARLWHLGAIWLPPASIALEVVPECARIWARDASLPAPIGAELRRLACRCPPLAQRGAESVFKVEESLRRFVRRRVPDWRTLLANITDRTHGDRLVALQKELEDLEARSGGPRPFFNSVEVVDLVDLMTLRDLVLLVRSKRPLESDVWRIRNRVMHGRTPTWHAMQILDDIERRLAGGGQA